ncbi:uncharacterized protein LOC113202755 [Frankliniella occidentalis]|uniref:Uncharacterized protein LOC113202755 n=1 Tax=Frankliniella occidentalis TaxID=133901 RepID=A0A6J1RVQ7_FRAOC|nr:uncharacterized protein LOC113202755 [Frankliniella occidentalis]XP_026272917.1 uncharacterized protein LOC113202755 [Frankliniella occidentalis]XP_052125734.1 uncharacterized protein LOC113202755 [Frankliniella occidentalis]XP_052125735.1 uncharacterized protein LOC113202755 [Frankliniella occidentalis]XP_052125736.1 uncharacterized protein LOC113202755 [Frankliniella occidentalis]
MTAPVGMRALLLAAAVAAIQVADALSSTPMTTARAWITLAGAATRDAPSKSPADYPLDSIFKLASNNSGVVVDTRLSSIMDHAVEVDDGDAADEAVLAHVATEAALRGGPCAVALLRALPDSKLATLMVLGAITLAAKGALQAPTAVVVQGLLRARRLLPGYKVVREHGHTRVVEVFRTSPYEWASLFEN